MTCFIVQTLDLRQALQSVVQHSAADPELTFGRVRCEVGRVNFELWATTGYTAGHAIVSVADNLDGTCEEPFDLTPDQVGEILALFKVPKDHELEAQLRIAVTDEHVTVTDCSGLFEGKSLSLPRTPLHEQYPDIRGLIGKHFDTTQVGDPQRPLLLANGDMLRAFTAAARAYKEPLAIEPVGSGNPRLLITCGESFVGLLMTITVDTAGEAGRDLMQWRDAWRERLPRYQRDVRRADPTPDTEADDREEPGDKKPRHLEPV